MGNKESHVLPASPFAIAASAPGRKIAGPREYVG